MERHRPARLLAVAALALVLPLSACGGVTTSHSSRCSGGTCTVNLTGVQTFEVDGPDGVERNLGVGPIEPDAVTLSVYGEPIIVDTKNLSHDWRKELIAKLAAVQRADGSFVGGKRWMEDNATISTAFAVLAAEDAIKDLTEHPAK